MAAAVVGEPLLRSELPGRHRWDLPALRHHPRLAAAVEAAVARTGGVRSAVANPLTGRLLVTFDPAVPSARIAAAVRAASVVEPLSVEAWKERESAAVRSSDVRDDPVLRRYVRKLWISGTSLVLGVGLMLTLGPGNPLFLAVTGTAMVVSGWGYLRGGFQALVHRRLTTDTLVATATVASILLGETLSGTVVIFLLTLGGYLEALTIRRTRRAIRNLLSDEDQQVWLVDGEVETRRPVEDVRVGDLIAVYPGEKIPVDGVIELGEGTINEAPITGESMPVERAGNARVWAGTLLMAGKLRVRVTGVGADTAIGRLIRRVEEAQELKPEIQTVGERFASKFVPFSFVLAGAVFLLTGNPVQALSMLLIACPCAAGLASPTALSAAIGNSARRGILIKGGTHLEAAANLDVVVFDKTGTLTEGTPSVQRLLPQGGFSGERLLALAAGAEVHAQHPLALAMIAAATERELVLPPHEDCEIIAGRGVRADGPEGRTLVGSRRLLDDYGVPVPEHAVAAERLHAGEGETVVYIAHDGAFAGQLGVMDRIRPEAPAALARLRRAGVRHLVMLTGDSEEVAAVVARTVGLSEWRARLLPEAKFEWIRSLRAQGHRVAMVGDGVNDAPALALADVGIAMGTAGSDVAIEAADVALAADDLEHVATMIEMSRRTIALIRQNYGMALGVNSVGILAGVFGALNPMLAAVLHNLSTILVVINSTRLIRFDPDAVVRPAPEAQAPGGRIVALQPVLARARPEGHVCVDAACCAAF